MSDLLIVVFVKGATLRNIGLSPITIRNIEACRTIGRPIYTGYFPLNKELSLEKQYRCPNFCSRGISLLDGNTAPKLL